MAKLQQILALTIGTLTFRVRLDEGLDPDAIVVRDQESLDLLLQAVADDARAVEPEPVSDSSVVALASRRNGQGPAGGRPKPYYADPAVLRRLAERRGIRLIDLQPPPKAAGAKGHGGVSKLGAIGIPSRAVLADELLHMGDDALPGIEYDVLVFAAAGISIGHTVERLKSRHPGLTASAATLARRTGAARLGFTVPRVRVT